MSNRKLRNDLRALELQVAQLAARMDAIQYHPIPYHPVPVQPMPTHPTTDPLGRPIVTCSTPARCEVREAFIG